MRQLQRWTGVLVLASAITGSACATRTPLAERLERAADCAQMLADGFRPVAGEQDRRFLGKVDASVANCRGGQQAVAKRGTPWLDWSNYYATGDADSKSGSDLADRIGVDGALLDLEVQRLELITFNLRDNSGTYPVYAQGRNGTPGPALDVWPEMRLPSDHPSFAAVGGAGVQECRGALVRHRTLTGICNDVKNPLMGSQGTLFARNVSFESTFPRLAGTELARNRHGERLDLLRPDPQVISRRLFTRPQTAPERCRNGEGAAVDATCEYREAPFFNVLAAFWIQFMTHDWFSHVDNGHNAEVDGAPDLMRVGCERHLVDGVWVPLTPEEIAALGCRPDDRMDRALVAEAGAPPTFDQAGVTRLGRSPQTSRNLVTAWWDASQIYGYDAASRQRVKRARADRAKLLMVERGNHAGAGERLGYLPHLENCESASGDCTPDPMNPVWVGQEATGFPDNWNIGLSFFHNLFVREHNVIVDEFRRLTERDREGDSGLRDPAHPERVIRYGDVTEDELFEVARLIVAAEIAKIHTIEWTPQLLYNEPLYLAMNANWGGLLDETSAVSDALKELIRRFGQSDDVRRRNQLYSAIAGGGRALSVWATGCRVGVVSSGCSGRDAMTGM